MKRTFIPGSEWLFFKLYTGYKSADNILLNFIYPLILELKKEKLISGFFFIRYVDPQPHIRFRIRIQDLAYYTIVFQKIYNVFSPCVNNGLLISVVCDTYQRELERYGENTIELTEQLFDIDSLAILELLDVLQNSNNSEQERWLLSLQLIDDLFMSFNYNLEEKSEQINNYSKNYLVEFHFDGQYHKQLDHKYRENRTMIEGVLNRSLLLQYAPILERRKEKLKIKGEELQYYKRENLLMVKLDNLLCSYIHMTMNRLFRSKNPIYEMVIYYFLDKYYKSEIAKKKYTSRKILVLNPEN